MQKRLDAGIQERQHVHPLLSAGRQHAPVPFQPAIAPVAPSSLRHLPVDRHLANRLFAEVVRRRNIRFDKAKIFVSPIPKTLRNVARILARRTALRNRASTARISTTPQDRFPMSLHFPQPSRRRPTVSPMHRREHFANLFQQSFSVTDDRLVLAFGEKRHFAPCCGNTEVSPTEPERHRSQSVEFPVRSPRCLLKRARNRSGIIQAEQLLQHDASPRRIHVE